MTASTNSVVVGVRSRATQIAALVAMTAMVLLGGEAEASGKLLALRFARLVDGTGKVIQNPLVVVENDRIKSVGSSTTPIPDGATVMDLSQYTAIPGLVDVHTHMTYLFDDQSPLKPVEQFIRRMPSVTVFLAQQNARRALEVGVTTVRDLGSFDYMDIAMRDLIRRGAMVGPRMFVSGVPIFATDEVVKPGQQPTMGTADGPIEVMRVARLQLVVGVD